MFTREKKAKRYEQMRERRRAKFRKRLERMRPLLLFLQRSKKATVDALVGVGKKYGILRYPVIAVLAVFLFIYHMFYQTLVCIKLQEKLARGVAFALTLCMVVTSVNVTALAVGSSGDESGQAAQTLICGKEEHTHTDACYEKQLICGLEEDHVHTDACYESNQVLICKNTDADHVHTDDCYETEQVLICGQEEGHRHTDACYETVLTCGKEEHKHADACYTQTENTNDAIASQSSDGTAVQDADEVTFANGGYPYGKNMDKAFVQLVAELESGTANHVEWQCSVNRNFDTYEVLSNQKSLTTSSFAPKDGYWYRCVVNYDYISKAVQFAKPYGSVMTHPTLEENLTGWFITNGYIAYKVGEKNFDVYGKYTVETGEYAGTYWIQTGHDNEGWAIFTQPMDLPSSVDGTAVIGNGGLNKLRVAFIPGDNYGVNMEAFLGSRAAFAIGADTQLGNSATSGEYADRASLKAIKNQNNNNLTQIQMVGARTVDTAVAGNPSFVIKFDTDNLPTYYWLGRYNSRRLWANGPYDDFNADTYKESEQNKADSGMTVSWCNLYDVSSVKFSFYVGTVEDAGAVIKPTATATSTALTLTNLDIGYEYQLVDENGNPATGYTEWRSPDADGQLIYSGLTPNTKYKVQSRKKDTTTVEDVDVDATTAVDPTVNSNASTGSSTKTEVKVDFRTITISNADASYSYCLQDEDGYEMTQWMKPDSDNTVRFEGLKEAKTYYLVAKTVDNNRSDRIEYTTPSRTYQIRFDANGNGDRVEGTLPSAQSKMSGRVVLIPDTELTRQGYVFLGWSRKADAKTAEYKAGDAYGEDADVTLYAVWHQKGELPLLEDTQTYEYTGSGQSFKLQYEDSVSVSGVDVKYYVAGTETQVSNVKEVGRYDVKITRAEDNLYKAYDKTLRGALVITKASSWTSSPTSLRSTPTSYYTNNDSGMHMTDGSITGVTSDMEYRAEGEDAYHPIDGTTVSNLANGTYYVRYKDNESHVAGPDSKITIGGGQQDDTAPNASVTLGENTWKAFLNDITFGLLFKDTVMVQVDATDDGCGLGSLSYWIASEAKTLDEVKANTNWTKTDFSAAGKATFDVEPSGEKVAYIKVEDKLGNAAYLSTDGMRIYRLEDTISVKNQSEWEEAISAGYKKLEIPDTVKDFAVENDLTIPSEVTVSISEQTKVTIADNVTLTNNGKLTNNGHIAGGSIFNNGTLVNGSKASVKSPVVHTNGGSAENLNQVTWKDDAGEYYGSIEDALTVTPAAGEITIDKDIVLPAKDLKISADTTVTISAGVTVTVPQGSSLENAGNLENKGSLVNNGTVENHGTIENKGQITNNGIWNNDGQMLGEGQWTDTTKKENPDTDSGNTADNPTPGDQTTGNDGTSSGNQISANAGTVSENRVEQTGKTRRSRLENRADNTADTNEEVASELENVIYEEAKDRPIKQSTNVSMGSGNVLINISSLDEEGQESANAIKGLILTSCDNVIKSCLTEEEIKAVEKGEKIEIVLTVQKMDTVVSKSDKKQIEKAAATMEQQIPGLTVGQYVDISVMKKIGSADWKKLSKLNDEMEISIDVPDELEKDGRSYFIMRNHDGSCYLLDDQDDQADTITIRTGLFSTYAIMYTDIATSQWSQNATQSLNEGAIRGEADAVCHWHFMILALLVIFVVLLYVMRKSSLAVRLSMLAVNAVSGLAFAMVGTCNLDWICFILDMIISIVALFLVSRVRQIKDKE